MLARGMDARGSLAYPNMCLEIVAHFIVKKMRSIYSKEVRDCKAQPHCLDASSFTSSGEGCSQDELLPVDPARVSVKTKAPIHSHQQY